MRNLIIAAVLALSVAPASAAVIRNGSFETTASVDGQAVAIIGAGSNVIRSWTIGSGNVDLVSSRYWDASDGSNSVDLSGSEAGSISTGIFGLTVGRLYDVMFDIAGNPDGGPTTKQITAEVSAVGVVRPPKTFSTVQADSRGEMNWASRIFTFTAAAPTQLLTFRALGTSSYGAAIDNVRIAVQAVPLPATAPLALLGLAGLAFLRRRKTA
jgi:choice-of-anchor C domain-containing protein